jgi:hypothetical protein
LLLKLPVVPIIETMAFMPKPDASGYGNTTLGRSIDQPYTVRFFQERLDIPGTNRVAATRCEHIKMLMASSASYLKRLASPEQGKAFHDTPLDPHRNRSCL